MTIYLGKISQKDCRISPQSNNSSVLITGISGSGKTCRMQQTELDSAKNGHTVIVLDTSNSHSSEQIYAPLRSDYSSLANRMSATLDGIDLHLLSGNPAYAVINCATQAIAKPSLLGVNQTKLLRNAVASAYHHFSSGENEIVTIGSALKEQGESGKNLYERLWPLFECNAIRPSKYQIQSGRINIIDLSDLDSDTQKMISEIFLSCLWRQVRYSPGSQTEFDIFLDECQRLYLKKDSLASQLLREGRKFHINLILATQSLAIFNKDSVSMLEQADTKLYFRPSPKDLRQIAKQLSLLDNSDWAQKLSTLNTGQCIAIGSISVDHGTINRPLTLN